MGVEIQPSYFRFTILNLRTSLLLIRSLPENGLIEVETYGEGKRRLLASQIMSKFLVFIIYSHYGVMKIYVQESNT
jgi:hypothetical protein